MKNIKNTKYILFYSHGDHVYYCFRSSRSRKELIKCFNQEHEFVKYVFAIPCNKMLFLLDYGIYDGDYMALDDYLYNNAPNMTKAKMLVQYVRDHYGEILTDCEDYLNEGC